MWLNREKLTGEGENINLNAINYNNWHLLLKFLCLEFNKISKSIEPITLEILLQLQGHSRPILLVCALLLSKPKPKTIFNLAVLIVKPIWQKPANLKSA